MPSPSRPFARSAPRYARGRPDYPAALISWALPAASANVVDLAAGSGQLTRGLLAAGHRVIAVEPVAEMVAELRASSPNAIAVQAVAEAIPLRSGSADVVTIGQAFHWLDPDVALPEIARVLRSGGALVLAYNLLDVSVPWVRRLRELIGGGRVELPEQVEALGLHPDFEQPTHKIFRHWQELRRTQLVDLVASYSYVHTLSPDARAALLRDVAAFFDTTTDSQTLRLPYRSHAIRAAVSTLGDFHRG
jgi:SAM-dependent methyltransferase